MLGTGIQRLVHHRSNQIIEITSKTGGLLLISYTHCHYLFIQYFAIIRYIETRMCNARLSFSQIYFCLCHIIQPWLIKHIHAIKIFKYRYCPACRTTFIATRFWVVMICPIIKCLTVLEFSFILFDLCLFITIFNFILNYVPIVTFLDIYLS